MLLRRLLRLRRLFELGQSEPVISKRLVEHLVAEFIARVRAPVLDDGADFRFRARALDDLEPVLGRRLRRGGDDLDRVAGFEAVLQRDDLAVDLGADAFVADVGVDGVGEIQRRRSVESWRTSPFGREDENVLGEEIDLDGLQKLVRIRKVLVPLEQAVDPLEFSRERESNLPSLYFQCAAMPPSAT